MQQAQQQGGARALMRALASMGPVSRDIYLVRAAPSPGLRRRHASEERQNALVERMASLTQGAREEEAEQEGRSSAHRPARFSNTYALSGTPGELLGGASRYGKAQGSQGVGFLCNAPAPGLI